MSEQMIGGQVRRGTSRGRQVWNAAGLLAMAATLPGCQNISGNPTLAQVRVVDASPDAGGIDVYEAGQPLAYNLGLGTITSYIPLTPANDLITTDAAGTQTQLSAARGTFAANGQYTIVIGEYLTSLQETILTDRSTPAPFGQVALRIIDQSSRGGAVDVYLIPAGSTISEVAPAVTDVAMGTNTGYLLVPAATYSIAVLPTGTVPTNSTATSYSGAATVFPGSSARTLIILDQQLITTPGVQVVLADDFDPVNSTT